MITIIVGTSGSGKTTFAHSYFGKENELVSCTTREKRPEEVEGVDYNFITDEEYWYLKDHGFLSVETEYAGNKYGMTQYEVLKNEDNENAFSIVDIHGCKDLMNICIEYDIDYRILYFKVDKEVVEERLNKRGDKVEDIGRRLKQIPVDNRNNLWLYGQEKCRVIDGNKDLDNILEQFEKIKLKEKRSEERSKRRL